MPVNLTVLHGTAKEGPCCVLVRYKGFSGPRCYCNARNVVMKSRIHDEPLENVVSCPVCEAYRQRLVEFWAGGSAGPMPAGSEGQHA